MNKKVWRCPRCKFNVSDYPAISRVDNKTEICSSCGTEEAMFAFKQALQRKAEERWKN